MASVQQTPDAARSENLKSLFRHAKKCRRAPTLRCVDGFRQRRKCALHRAPVADCAMGVGTPPTSVSTPCYVEKFRCDIGGQANCVLYFSLTLSREKFHADTHRRRSPDRPTRLEADARGRPVGNRRQGSDNGDEALELARKVEWDMAIFDFTMPGRSGLDLLGDMKKEFPAARC